MQKDNLRSAVYKSLKKSLPLCESSNETVGCGAMRKSKNSSTTVVEPLLYTRKAHQESVPAFLGTKKEENVMAYGENCDLQILQISRGAQKLKQVIDSWSKAPNFDGRSEDIAADLMRGALDLQASLAMLRKLQEDPKFMAQARRKQDQNFIVEEEATDFQCMGSKRRQAPHQNRMQEPRFSVDGSSMSCLEEIKKVIKDSLQRQDLLSISSDDEDASVNRSPNSPTIGETKNTFCYKKGKTNSSVSSDSQHKRMNLVAQLMGLEEGPSITAQRFRTEQTMKSIEGPFRKEPDRSKSSNSNLRRQAFDIEMPKARKLHLEDQDQDPKRKTLQEIIDTMQFKGLLKRGQVQDNMVQSVLSTTSRCDENYCMDAQVPPIVIMKPMCLPYSEREDARVGLLKNLPPPKDIQTTQLTVEKVITLVPRQLARKEEQPLKETKMVQSIENRASVSVLHRHQRREAIIERKKPQVQEPIKERKKPQVQGSMFNKRKPEENENLRTLTLSTSHVKTTPSVPSKLEKRPVPARSQILTKSSDLLHKKSNIGTCTSGVSVRSAKENKLTKPKPAREMVVLVEANNSKFKEGRKAIRPAHLTKQLNPADNSKFKEERKAIRPAHVTRQLNRADNSISKEDRKAIRPAHVTVTPTAHCTAADHLSKPTGHDFKTQEEDQGERDQTSLCEVMSKHCQGEKSSVSAEEATKSADTETTNQKPVIKEDQRKWFLMGNPSFSLRAQELFGIRILPSFDCQRSASVESAVIDAKLFLDTANEIMAYKSYQVELTNHPMLNTNLTRWKGKISLDRLAEEVGSDIEKLTSYSRFGDGCPSGDYLHTRLERDIRCNGMLMNGGWNMGWMNWISLEEADLIVQDVEMHILLLLIEEVTVDLIY